MLVFSLAGAPVSVSQDETRAVDLLYCRSPGIKLIIVAGQSTTCADHQILNLSFQIYSHRIKLA